MATPAAPAPAMTIRRSAIYLPTILSEFSSAASVTTAVPCWSSWNTGMSSSPEPLLDLEARRRGDVLEVDAAEDRGDAHDGLDDDVDRSSSEASPSTSRQIGKPSTPANFLNRSALPSMTGRAASGPMSPRPSTAVPSVTMATVFFLMVSSWTRAGSPLDGGADPGHARRVGHREVVAVADRHAGQHLDLAALVHGEGAVLTDRTSTPSMSRTASTTCCCAPRWCS